VDEGGRWLAAGLVLAVLVHIPGLSAGPVADDPLRFAETLTDLSTALEWVYRPFPDTPGPLPDSFSPKLYRPVWRLSYWLDGRLFSGMFGGPFPLLGPRLLSLGLHLLLVLGVARLVARWDARVAPLAAALVAVHPLMVSPVAWVSARGGLLVAVCLVWSAWAAERRRWGLLGALLLLALGSKETALVAPGLLFLWTRDRRVLAASTALTAGVLLVRWRVLGTPLGGFSDLPVLGSADWLSRLLGHLKLWICGVPGGWSVLVSGLCIGVFVVRGLRGRARLLLPWAVLALLPHHRLFADPDTGLHARFLSDATIPLCVALAFGLRTVPLRFRALTTGLVLVALAGASLDRVLVWRAAAGLVDKARQEGTVPDLPDVYEGVSVRANLLPALSEPPWRSD